MKHSKSKVNLDQLHKDIKQLSNKAFEKRYHGVTKEHIRGMSDAELENVAGGLVVGTKGGWTAPVFKP